MCDSSHSKHRQSESQNSWKRRMTKKAKLSVKTRLAMLDKKFPLVPHTRMGQLSSAVRRMKAEKELEIPVNRRSSIAMSVRIEKAANEMTDSEWKTFYGELCEELRRDYPDQYAHIFPNGHI
jgi:hypothetical protein